MPNANRQASKYGTGDVARILRCSTNAVRAHDAELTPEFTANGRRLYDPERIERIAAALDASRDAAQGGT